MMNNNNLKSEITILKTWKWEIFEIDLKYEDFLIIESQLKMKWEDWFNSEKYRRFIKFSAIEDKIWKTRYLSLEQPKKDKRFCEMSHTEKEDLKKTNNDLYYKLLHDDEKRREKIAEKIKKAMDQTLDGRKKNFLIYRDGVLKELEKREKDFWLETTIEKLNQYLKLKIK